MKKKIRNLLVAAIGMMAFSFLSCAQEPAEKKPLTPAEVLSKITIGDEVLVNSKDGNFSRASLTVPAPVGEDAERISLNVNSTSHGTLCQYFLKYGLSQLPELQTMDGFDTIIDWGRFKNDRHSYGQETEDYLVKYWGSFKNQIDQFMMGKLCVKKVSDDKYIVIQVDKDAKFQHYIILTEAYGNFNIQFYAYENMGPNPKPDVYYEETTFSSPTDFTINRTYYNSENIKEYMDITINEYQSYKLGTKEIAVFKDGKMHGISQYLNNSNNTYFTSYSFTDFNSVARFYYHSIKDKTDYTYEYGTFENAGCLVKRITEISKDKKVSYAPYYLKLNDGQTPYRISTVNDTDVYYTIPEEYVGSDKTYTCTSPVDEDALNRELQASMNLETTMISDIPDFRDNFSALHIFWIEHKKEYFVDTE